MSLCYVESLSQNFSSYGHLKQFDCFLKNTLYYSPWFIPKIVSEVNPNITVHLLVCIDVLNYTIGIQYDHRHYCSLLEAHINNYYYCVIMSQYKLILVSLYRTR